ncbi:MAG: restriction endonuclease [Phototrophicaceae bacterium]
MAVPKYNELMLPLLQFSSDGDEHHVRDASNIIAEHLLLTDQQITELLPSGKKTKYYDRIHWAKTYLTKAGLLKTTGRGLFKITQRGFDLLNTNPTEIDNKLLSQFEEFIEFQTPNRQSESISVNEIELEDEQTPEEQIDNLYRKLRKTLSDELLETVLSVSPRFFERLVVDLLLAMGYGSSLDSGEHLGQSNDGGVDGVIREDKLGLDTIYIQAKRYALDNGVGRPAIQNFVGSLMGFGATKGVFITTSYFSQHAVDYANAMNNMKIILIDGQQLATLMIEHNVGISVQKLYEIKQIDENYFPDV